MIKMSNRIKIPSPLRQFTDNQSYVEVDGLTIKEVLQKIFDQYPQIKSHILDQNGEIRNFVNIYVNGTNIKEEDNLDTTVPVDSDIRIIPAIAGGLEEAAKVLVVGVGGLGSPVLLYLAAAGIGRIGLVDFDLVDESNLQRQILFGVDVLGKSKTKSAEKKLLQLNPNLRLDIYETRLTSENALNILEHYDIIIDGTDNFQTRYLVNDACVILGKPNVYGSIFRFEGQASVFNYKDGPCYRCLYPEPPPPGLVPSCAEGGVLGVLPGIIGCIQANETIKIITGIGKTLKGRFLLYDALELDFQEVEKHYGIKVKLVA